MPLPSPAHEVAPQWAWQPSEDVIAAARVVARIRNGKNGGQSNLPGGETANDAERERQHFYAYLSEDACSKLLNVAHSGVCKPGPDVYDVGFWIEVRSIQQARKGLLLRPKDRLPPPYVLVLIDPRSLTCQALGWCYGDEVKANGVVIDPHTDKPAWVLRQGALRPMDALARLIWGGDRG